MSAKSRQGDFTNHNPYYISGISFSAVSNELNSSLQNKCRYHIIIHCRYYYILLLYYTVVVLVAQSIVFWWTLHVQHSYWLERSHAYLPRGGFSAASQSTPSRCMHSDRNAFVISRIFNVFFFFKPSHICLE